jgi:hypothetical protein
MTIPSPKSPQPATLRFRVGVLLLIINIPFGYASVAVGAALFAKTHRVLWQAVGFGGYALSWAMLGLGLWMAGPEEKRLAREALRSFINRFKRNPPRDNELR